MASSDELDTLRGVAPEDADTLADFIRDQVCCARPVGGCELHCYPEDCPAERVRSALKAREASLGEARRERDRIGEAHDHAILHQKDLTDQLYAAEASLAQARRERDEARAALEPFAAYRGSDQYLASDAPDDGFCAAVSFRAGDFRRARECLASLKGEKDG